MKRKRQHLTIDPEEAEDIVGKKSLELMRKDKEKRIKEVEGPPVAKSIRKGGITFRCWPYEVGLRLDKNDREDVYER